MASAVPDATLLVFARAPQAGAVKTRLIPALGAEGAARVHVWMLQATLSRMRNLRFGRRVLAVTPDAACRRLREEWGPAFEVVRQGRGSLGERICRVVGKMFARSSGPVLIIGSDAPDLPEAMLVDAARIARRGAVALCPARDGGYCLIGLPGPLPALFSGIEWGSDAVAAQTREAAQVAGIGLAELGPWEDVDQIEDLGRLIERIRGQADAALRELHARLVSMKLPGLPEQGSRSDAI